MLRVSLCVWAVMQFSVNQRVEELDLQKDAPTERKSIKQNILGNEI